MGAQAQRLGLAAALNAAGSRWLLSKFLERDVPILGGMRFAPRSSPPADDPLQKYLEFLDGLPPAVAR